MIAAMVLGEIGDKSAVFSLVTSTEDRDSGVRMAAAEALEKLG